MAKCNGTQRLLAATSSLTLALLLLAGVLLLTQQAGPVEAPQVERLQGNPIITGDMLPGDAGKNINGPSLIRVPAWVQNPLGRYYLYFAHHKGRYIRLAYANQLSGPWKVHGPGTLRLDSTGCDAITDPHLASPDVHVDEGAQQIRMYFHCPANVPVPPGNRISHRQVSFAATSRDGLQFEAGTEPLGNAYFRVFRWNGAYYALAMPGVLYRSDDGLHNFTEGPTLFTRHMRHAALEVQGNTLNVFYSIVGENPERILLSRIDLDSDWMQWEETRPVVVLEPELEWEGASLPSGPSTRGIASGPLRQLRDPAIFKDDGRTYLLYTVRGESGIAIAELHWK